MYRLLVPRLSSPISKSSSFKRLDVRPVPANLGKVVMAREQVWETTSISPPFVMISAAAGSQTNVEGLKGS